MEELSKSTAWVPPFEKVKAIRKQAEETTRKAERLKMAKGMKKKKIDINIISELTGLTVGEIEKL